MFPPERLKPSLIPQTLTRGHSQAQPAKKKKKEPKKRIQRKKKDGKCVFKASGCVDWIPISSTDFHFGHLLHNCCPIIFQLFHALILLYFVIVFLLSDRQFLNPLYMLARGTLHFLLEFYWNFIN